MIAAIYAVVSSLDLGRRLGISDSDAQILYFAGTLLLALALVAVTIWYAYSTRSMVEQMRRQERPYVYISGETDFKQLFPFSLMLRNAGTRVALGVRIAFEQDAYIWRGDEVVGQRPSQRVPVSTIPFLAQPIVSLAPRDSRYLGSVAVPEVLSGEDQELRYTISYRDGAGVVYQERLALSYRA